MNIYHIVFKSTNVDHTSKGKNYKAINPAIAYRQFIIDYPEGVFIAMHDVNIMADIKGFARVD